MSDNRQWTDEAIVKAVQSGDASRDAALQWWFAQAELQRWVKQYAEQHGGTARDGEDLYHDTFITFDRLLRTDKFQGKSTLKTFFCSIAKWLWLNQQRKNGRIISTPTPQEDIGMLFAEDEMYQRERQAALERALSTLGDKCKKLLTLYQLSYSMREIAAAMGYASDQVAMNQSAECRKKLKSLIENHHEFKELRH